jgi:hypothetical protein
MMLSATDRRKATMSMWEEEMKKETWSVAV